MHKKSLNWKIKDSCHPSTTVFTQGRSYCCAKKRENTSIILKELLVEFVMHFFNYDFQGRVLAQGTYDELVEMNLDFVSLMIGDDETPESRKQSLVTIAEDVSKFNYCFFTQPKNWDKCSFVASKNICKVH